MIPLLRFLFLFWLLFLSAALQAQFAVIASDENTIALSDYHNNQLLLLSAAHSSKKYKLPLPVLLKNSTERAVGVNRLAINHAGNRLYWQNGQQIWMHQLKESKPLGEWRLLYEHPKSRGNLLGFYLHPKQSIMALMVEIDRRHSSSNPEAHHWTCRTVIPADLSATGIYPASPLLFSDHEQLDQVWVLDQWHLLAHYRNEETSARKLQLYHRIGMDHWELAEDDIFKGYYPQAPVAQLPNSLRIMLYPWSFDGPMAFADLEERPKDPSGRSIAQPQWIFSGDENQRLSMVYPHIPKSDRFMQKMAPGGLFVVGSHSETVDGITKKSHLFFPQALQRGKYLTGLHGGQHDTMVVEGFAYFYDLSNQFALVLRPIHSGHGVEVLLLSFYRRQLELLQRMEDY